MENRWWRLKSILLAIDRPSDSIFDVPLNVAKQEECRHFEPATQEYTPLFFRRLTYYYSERDGTVIVAGALADNGKSGQRSSAIH